MIFVTVGTHRQQFDRLLKEIDRLVKEGTVKEEVFAQTGNSTYVPQEYKSTKFLSDSEYNKMMKKADLVITHGGAGGIITAMGYRKKIIVVPRLEKFGEHTNDHQIELCEAISADGKAIIVKEIKRLGETIVGSKKFKPRTENTKEGLIKEVKGFIEGI